MTRPQDQPTRNALDIHTLGEGALVLNAGAGATLECQRRVWAVAAAAQWPHIYAVVPGMNNLTILFHPLLGDADVLAGKLLSAWETSNAIDKIGRQIEIPVVYGGNHGPDLLAVAQHTDLSIAEVVERHTRADYVVYFLGFQPGFAYLGGQDPLLTTPRRKDPRLKVPAGTVGIGGAQTGIYPTAAPGGWQLIGRTDLRLFDPSADPPTLLQPGDHVRFVATQVLS